MSYICIYHITNTTIHVSMGFFFMSDLQSLVVVFMWSLPTMNVDHVPKRFPHGLSISMSLYLRVTIEGGDFFMKIDGIECIYI